MREYCFMEIEDGHHCLLLKGHDGLHSKRTFSEQPPLAEQIRILDWAVREPYHLWGQIWTFCNCGWMTWMVDAGFLTEEPQECYGNEYRYGSFSWSTMAPFNHITEKGREFLRHHAPVEW